MTARRGLRISLVAHAAALALVTSSGPAPAQTPARTEQVTFALNWLPVGEAAGWYTALDKGYFAEHNLAVSIVRGLGSADTAKRVAAGRAQFGVADTGTVILLRNREGIKVRSVAMFFGRAPHAVFFRKDSGIKTPKDLEGKSIACPATSANKIMFPAFAARTKVDESRVTWRITEPAVAIPTFAAGRADAVCEFLTSRPVIVKQTPAEIGQFVYAEFGLEFYANGIVAHEDTIKQHPDLVRRFTRAAVRGLEYAIQHPQEATRILLKYAPENKPDIAAEEWKVAADLILTPEARQHGIGYMAPAKMASTYEVVTSAFNLDKGKDRAENLYTNEFLK
jgi:NitT/TauT family transport system substrate-binding protein